MTKPLTTAEKKWIAAMQVVIDACPSKRLGCYTIGDNSIEFFDKPANEAWLAAQPLKDTEIDVGLEMDKSGARLNATLYFPFQADSRSG